LLQEYHICRNGKDFAVLKIYYYLQPFKMNKYMKGRFLLMLAAALFMAVSMSSCVRDYICHCEVKYSGYPGLPDSTYREYPITDKKDAAKSQCEAATFTGELNGIKTVETCTLF
jgi:hypothetical protein